MLELKLSGRGGQGAVVAIHILGLAFFKAGFYPQCYSVYGGERRGAPVAAFMRVSDKPILLKCEIARPNQIIYLDETLFDAAEAEQSAGQGGLILINSASGRDKYPRLGGGRLGLINAGRIASENGLGKMINTSVLGAYCRLNNAPELKELLAAVEESVPAKKQANLQAVEQAYGALQANQSEGQ